MTEHARTGEEARVRRIRDEEGEEKWLVERYEDVKMALGGRRTEKLNETANEEISRIRRLVGRAFSPRRLERMRPRIQEITDELLDRIAAEDEVDLVPTFALPLPLAVNCELLGIPAEDREWFESMIRADRRFGPPGAGMWRWEEVVQYFATQIAERRPNVRNDLPADEQPDLIDIMIAALAEDEALTEDHITNSLTNLLSVGQVNLISDGMLALLEHPDQLRLLRDRPELISTAVDELLRYTSPVQQVYRDAVEEIEIGGTTLPAGSRLAVGIGPANRDGREFHDPDRLDVTRTESQRHLALGAGRHYCLGGPLAKQESEIAFATLLRRFPDITLSVPRDQLQWGQAWPYELTTLPVRLRATTPARAE